MDTHDTEICGFLDVKLMGNRYIAQKIRKKTLVSKIWRRVWCSIKKLGPELGVQIQFNTLTKFNRSSNALKQSNSVIIPPNAIVYRICSKTKQFAFGISSTKDRKTLLSLSANSETETQRWITNIRYLLKPRRHHCMRKSYYISLIDNAHSKAAGLTGLHGDLIASETGILVKDVYTGKTVETFEWKEFSQFHLTTAGRPEDVKRICVIHTTEKFCHGIGELYIFCLDANKLLLDLVTQGRGPKYRQKFLNFNDENLEDSMQHDGINNSSQLRSNISLDTFNTDANCEKIDSYSHKESNTSIASGIYEEIIDNIDSSKPRKFTSNMYENTDKILCNVQMEPPPLPPRQNQKLEYTKEDRVDTGQFSYAEISNLETKLQNIEVCIGKATLIDSSYVPMSPQLKDFNTLKFNVTEENDYVIMQ